MIPLTLRRCYASGIPDLASYEPGEDNFAYLLNIEVSPVGDDEFETFATLVCTPKWLSKRLDQQPIINGAHHIIVADHDYSELVDFVRTFVEGINLERWGDLPRAMDRLAKWADEVPDEPGHHIT